MNALLALVFVALVALFVGLALVAREIRELRGSLDDTATVVEMRSDSTMHYVGDVFAANVLRAAAEDLDSVEGQTTMNRIGNTQFKIGGPSLGNLWLHDRADALLDKHPDTP